MRALVCLPTYNEKKNIAEMVRLIRTETTGLSLDILVIDSASPDGTAEVVLELQKVDPCLFLFRQPAKLGLGKAYLDGMRWALTKPYDYVITMDADLSHHPRYLRPMLAVAPDHDLVIGSRYAKGGRLENWPLRRRILSRFANWYATTLTGLPFEDLTSGFHCFHTPLLKLILDHPIQTEGYAFLVELKYHAIMHGATFAEVPIIFTDRINGDSKISKQVIRESVLFVLKLFRQRSKVKKAIREKRSRE